MGISLKRGNLLLSLTCWRFKNVSLSIFNHLVFYNSISGIKSLEKYLIIYGINCLFISVFRYFSPKLVIETLKIAFPPSVIDFSELTQPIPSSLLRAGLSEPKLGLKKA